MTMLSRPNPHPRLVRNRPPRPLINLLPGPLRNHHRRHLLNLRLPLLLSLLQEHLPNLPPGVALRNPLRRFVASSLLGVLPYSRYQNITLSNVLNLYPIVFRLMLPLSKVKNLSQLLARLSLKILRPRLRPKAPLQKTLQTRHLRYVCITVWIGGAPFDTYDVGGLSLSHSLPVPSIHLSFIPPFIVP